MAKSGDVMVTDAFQKAWDEVRGDVGRFNLAIFGKSGVGKSTLINAIFGAEVAETGIGRPVTQHDHLYVTESGSLGIFDTRGLEVGAENGRILAELREYIGAMRRKPVEDQIHLAWYCVRASDNRFEDTEADFVKALAELGLPVLAVMTQVERRNDRYHPSAVELIEHIEGRSLPVGDERVFPTMALEDDFRGLQEHGLKDLLDATFRHAPDAVAEALTAAQVIDGERKQEAVKDAISLAVGLASAAGASPIPFSDAVVLVPIQMSMLARIAHVRGVDFDQATAATLTLTAASTAAGRSLVTNLIKMVPGAGTIVGGTISSAVAAAITWSMGQAWDLVCKKLVAGEVPIVDGALKSDVVRDLFVTEFKSQVAKARPKGGK